MHRQLVPGQLWCILIVLIVLILCLYVHNVMYHGDEQALYETVFDIEVCTVMGTAGIPR